MKKSIKLTFDTITDIFSFFDKIKIYDIYKIHISLVIIIDDQTSIKSIKSFIYNDFTFLQNTLLNEIAKFLDEYNQKNSTISKYIIDILILTDDDKNYNIYKEIIINEFSNKTYTTFKKIKYKILKILITIIKWIQKRISNL